MGVAGLWRYRGFIVGMIKRDFQARYRNSLLGAAWTILNPLTMIAIYTLVFSQVMRSKLPGVDSAFSYSIFIMAGLIPWGLFSELVVRASTVFLDNANLIKKVRFPLLSLVVVNTSACMINFLIVLGVFAALMLFLGLLPGWQLLGLIPLTLLQILLANGIGLILGVANVFFRDVGQITNIGLQFGFWLTPIVYQLNIIPEPFRSYASLNPLVPIFESYQRIFVHQLWPEWSDLYIVAMIAVLLNMIAGLMYASMYDQILDEI